MPPYTSSQRIALSQFIAVTQAPEKVAVRALKTYNWNVQQAIDSYFHGGAQAAQAATPNHTVALNKLFDSYRDAPAESPDTIGINGSMSYLNALGVDLDEPVVFAIMEIVDSQSMGEIPRKGFVEGWTRIRGESIQKQQTLATQLRKGLTQDPEVFKRVYRHTFLLARSSGQKSVTLENAVEFWRTLFSPPGGVAWSTAQTPWLEYWLDFVQAKWKKSINRDMWNMLLEFMRKTKEDENFGWWDEGGAWPGSLDEFVLFVKQKRTEGGDMEVE